LLHKHTLEQKNSQKVSKNILNGCCQPWQS